MALNALFGTDEATEKFYTEGNVAFRQGKAPRTPTTYNAIFGANGTVSTTGQPAEFGANGRVIIPKMPIPPAGNGMARIPLASPPAIVIGSNMVAAAAAANHTAVTTDPPKPSYADLEAENQKLRNLLVERKLTFSTSGLE